MRALSLIGSAISLAGAVPAIAQDASAPAPICTDRPTKANLACTVPADDVQIESDAINWSRLSTGGVTTDTVLYSNPTLKYGVGGSTDVEINIAPYETIRTHDEGTSDTRHGAGDLTLRVKRQLTAPDAKVQIALDPFVKAPTAKRGIGNGAWEGGLDIPVLFSLPAGFTLNVGPELDLFADADGSGHHANLTTLVNLSHAVGSKATVYAEFWNAQNYDPAGTTRQYSADVALAYLLTPVLQVDLGGNFGLNRTTPDAQLYLGVSTRF